MFRSIIEWLFPANRPRQQAGAHRKADRVRIIVGLGNPGPKYRHTRHNVGFVVLDGVAQRLGAAFDREKHQAQYAETWRGSEKLLLLKPMTFMNRSGDSVALAARNKVQDPSEILVVVDDVNLPLGSLRFRHGGSAGGHNGLKSIAERLGTKEYARLRLGVGYTQDSGDLAGHVLSKFHPDERKDVDEMVQRAEEAVEYFVDHGINEAMNEFNRR